MKLIFAGTPAFAADALRALLARGHEVPLVLTQPDRPAGRGLAVQPAPVKTLALARRVPVLQPQGLRLGGRFDRDAQEAHERLSATPHDVMVVAAYGLILPPSILAIPPLGCINVHASLLPRWRGAAPIQRAIEAGDRETGITIMRMDAGLDTGAVLLVRSIPIADDDTAATLATKLADLGGDAIVEALDALEAGVLMATPQHRPGDESAVTYARKLVKGEGALDFTDTTRQLVDRIRAFDPWPGCTAELRLAGKERPVALKVWKAEALVDGAVLASERSREPGDVIGFIGASGTARTGIAVRTADGILLLTELQKAGGKRLPADAFERGLAD